MKKSFRQAFGVLALLLTACGQSPSATQIAPISAVDTTTPSPLPTATRTFLPTETPTASITPLPTIPTFTPTFDVSTILTVTPAPKAECPVIKENLPVDLIDFDDYYPELIAALNQGSSIQTVIAVFEKKIDEFYFPNKKISIPLKIRHEIVDVTNDGVPEILIPGSKSFQPNAIILSCRNGEYETLFFREYDTAHYIHLMPVDANRNGINEIILAEETSSATGTSFELSVIEWHIDSFREILPTVFESSAFQYVQVSDLDNDKTKEIHWLFSEYIFSFPPWRRGVVVYKWNGEQFVRFLVTYDPVQYRFQAIQDGDHATIIGNYADAQNLYQEAIFNQDLEWWSPQRQLDTSRKLTDEGYAAFGTPVPGITDPAEYPRLAAYAYYRIMLLHLVQNYESDATTVYNTLQEKFGNDPYGHPFVEMTTAFWNAYQSTHKMYDGCAAAIQYAVEHPEILTPLGSDYHGAQSHTYVPADVCPFR